jgi:hypothetical protein
VREQAIEAALQLADVREVHPRQLLEHPVAKARRALPLQFLQNGDTRLVVWNADVDDQPAGQSCQQPIGHVSDFVRGTVTRHHDLRAAPLQHVEEPQQLALDFGTPGQELDIVQEQHTGGFVSLPERLEPPALHRLVKLLHIVIERDILDAEGRLLVPGGVPHGVHQVCLAETRGTVDEQGVVQHARRVGHRLGCGDSEAIGRACDEGIEAEALIEFHESAVSSLRRLAYRIGH